MISRWFRLRRDQGYAGSISSGTRRTELTPVSAMATAAEDHPRCTHGDNARRRPCHCMGIVGSLTGPTAPFGITTAGTRRFLGGEPLDSYPLREELSVLGAARIGRRAACVAKVHG